MFDSHLAAIALYLSVVLLIILSTIVTFFIQEYQGSVDELKHYSSIYTTTNLGCASCSKKFYLTILSSSNLCLKT